MARKQKKVTKNRKAIRAAKLGDALRQKANAVMARAEQLKAKADRLESVGSAEGLGLLEARDKTLVRLRRIEERLVALGIDFNS